jgi:hypothetical protein
MDRFRANLHSYKSVIVHSPESFGPTAVAGTTIHPQSGECWQITVKPYSLSF